MYKKEKSIQLVGSASMLSNNVDSLFNPSKNSVHFAVVHKTIVNVISSAMDGSSHTQNQFASKEQTNSNPIIILQAKLLQLGNRMILVLCTQRGIQMFETDGAAMIYWNALEDSKDKQGSCHARGVCSVGNDTICAGIYTGHVLVFNVPSKGTNITQQESLAGHKCAVSDLAGGQGKEFASSDDEGNIILWKSSGSKYKEALRTPGYGYPCSCLLLWKDLIIGGYGSGHIRVFSATSGSIALEVDAHARWITGLDITKNGLLLSTSNDSFARVWQVTSGPPMIEHKHSECVTDLQLVGGAFSLPDGRSFCVAGYDSNELIFYRS